MVLCGLSCNCYLLIFPNKYPKISLTGLWLLINMEPRPRRWAKLLRHQFGDSKLHVHHSSLPGSAGLRGTGSSPQTLAANGSSSSMALEATPRPTAG